MERKLCLLAEDEETVMSLYREVFESFFSEEIEFLYAENVSEALEVIRQESRPIDIMILDGLEGGCWDIIAVAKESALTWHRRLGQLQTEWETGRGDRLLLHQAALRAIEADQDLLHAVVEWRIAQVKLWEAKGVLSGEWGVGSGENE